MSYTTRVRTATTHDGRIVHETHPEAAFILFSTGQTVPDHVEKKHKLRAVEDEIIAEHPEHEGYRPGFRHGHDHSDAQAAATELQARQRNAMPFGVTSTQPLGNSGVIPADRVEPRIVVEDWEDVTVVHGEAEAVEGLPVGGRVTNERTRRDARLPSTEDAKKEAATGETPPAEPKATRGKASKEAETSEVEPATEGE